MAKTTKQKEVTQAAPQPPVFSYRHFTVRYTRDKVSRFVSPCPKCNQ